MPGTIPFFCDFLKMEILFLGDSIPAGKWDFCYMKTIMHNLAFVLLAACGSFSVVLGQTGNTGIGTTDPQAKLHVNGDLRLQNGVSVNKFSTDSLFSSNSHSVIPTEKAIKDYIQRGLWLGVDTQQVSGMALVPRTAVNIGAGAPLDVAIEGDYAYVINDVYGSISVWNIADRYNPVFRSQTATNLSAPASVAVQNGIVYVASYANDRLCLFNVSNPGSIQPLGYVTGTMRQPEQVRVSGTTAFVKCRLTNAIHIFDVSNTAAPVQVAAIATGYLDDFTVNGSFLYGVSSSSNKMVIVNATNPAAPVISSQYTSGMTGARCIYVKDNYAYAGLYTFGRMRIINVSDPVNPVYANQIDADITAQTKFRGSGRYLFLNGWVNEIQVFDIGTATVPVFKGYNNTNLSDVQPFAVSGDLVVVPSYSNGNLALFELDRSRQLTFTSSGVQPVSSPWITNGTMTFHAGDRVGIGVSNPKARFHVEGGSYLNGYVGIGVESPLQQLAVGGNAYTTGNISIGTSDQFANLTLSNLLGPRIALWANSATSQYGLGIQSGLMQFYTDLSASDFAFGYGSSNNFTEKFRIKGNGNVGIGLSNPTRPLSFPATLEKKISFYPGATGDVGISVSGNDLRLYSDNVNARVSFGYDDYTNGFTSRAYVLATGTTAMVVQGNMTVNGTNYNSDVRFKQQIRPLQGALEKVTALQGVQYEMRVKEFPDRNFQPGTEIGLIAQDVEKVLPELVRTDADGYKSVDYAKLVPVLIEGVKSQQLQIQALQEQNRSQLEKMNQLLRRIEQLEKSVKQ